MRGTSNSSSLILIDSYREDGGRLFLEIHNDRARGYRSCYNRGYFNLTPGKLVFPVDMVKH